MTQAPTPGPLSAVDVKLLVKGDLLRIDTGGALYEFVRRKSPPSALIVAKPALGGSERYYDRCRFSFVERPSLSPTAQVEASGSGREWITGDDLHEIMTTFDERADVSEIAAKINQRIALRPQPSGETREAVRAILGRHLANNPGQAAFENAADAILALIRPAPVAETAGEAVGVVSGCARADLYTADLPTGTPLYASPVPAQDDDKLRIAVEALEPFAAFAQVAEAKSRMALGKVLSDDEILASISWEGGLGVLVMGHFRDALSVAPKPKGWGGLYRRSKALAALKSEGRS